MDIVIKNTVVVTIDKEKPILKDYSVGVEDGKIVEISKKITGETEHVIDGKGKLLMPGLVNGHTHLSMTLLRGVADDLALMTWLQDHVWPIEAKMEESHIKAGADLGIVEMIKSGTTCFNDMYWHMEIVAKSVENSGMRAVLSTPLLDVMGPEQRGKLLHGGEKLIKTLKGHKTITPSLGPHAPYTCSEEMLHKVSDLQEKYDVRVHMHVSETEDEVNNMKNDRGKRPFEYLDGIGFLNEQMVAAHGVWVNENEMEIMKNRGVSVVHNPVSNMKLAVGVAPVPEYLEKGIVVGLGTDGAASNNSLCMFEDLKIAALLHKLHSKNPEILSAKKSLEIATLGGARALGLGDKIGSIEVGKQADLILIDLNKPHLTPFSNPVSHLVYSARGDDVSHTIVDGKILMEDRELTTLDEESVLKEAGVQAGDLLESSGTSDKLF